MGAHDHQQQGGELWETTRAVQKKKKKKKLESDIPMSDITVDISLPRSQLELHVIDLCKNLFAKWSCLDHSRFSVQPLSDGITNLLFKVSAVREGSGNDVSVVVRLYGPNTELFIDRDRELQAIGHLSAAGFGAKLLGVFGNGMVLSFINASALTLEDMSSRNIAPKIAKELRKFHQVEVPGSKEPQLWNDISKFLEEAASLEFEDAVNQTKYEEISFEEVRRDISQLKGLLDRLNSPVVFAHNDLLSGNMLLGKDEDKLYLIDFEYGSYNYRGFDISNHFNEYAGFECDYKLFPSKDAQYNFFRNYLKPNKPHEVTDQDLEALYVETNCFTLASHIYWALWALIQAKVSPIDFDYLGYFFKRYDEYKNRKENCFSLADEYLSIKISTTQLNSMNPTLPPRIHKSEEKLNLVEDSLE